jgi:hypothetical protein
MGKFGWLLLTAPRGGFQRKTDFKCDVKCIYGITDKINNISFEGLDTLSLVHTGGF